MNSHKFGGQSSSSVGRWLRRRKQVIAVVEKGIDLAEKISSIEF
jgi:hypothetical protein